MKFKTLIGLMASGQLGFLFRLNSAFRQSYRSSFVAAGCLKESMLNFAITRPASTSCTNTWLALVPMTLPLETIFPRTSSKPGWILASASVNSTDPDGYSLRSRFSRQLAQPSNDSIAAMYEEVCTLHHDLLIQTPARLLKPVFQDGRCGWPVNCPVFAHFGTSYR